MARLVKGDTTRNKAQDTFTATQRRDEAFRSQIERERQARDAKSARLRELRLAKEAADRIEAELAALQEPKKAPARAARKKKAAANKSAGSLES